MVGFSRLYCSIFATTVGVATFGLLPPMIPGGLKEPEIEREKMSPFLAYRLKIPSINNPKEREMISWVMCRDKQGMKGWTERSVTNDYLCPIDTSADHRR